MTQISFDLISDLHTDTHPDFDWSGQPTSPNAIVLGDVADDLATLVGTLEHLAAVYQHVFYIDGNSDHSRRHDCLDRSYTVLAGAIEHIPNVTFLQDNVVIINGLALLGTNGWFTYDFDPDSDQMSAIRDYAASHYMSEGAAASLFQMASSDSAYLVNSVRRLQRHPDVKTIVVCTHTVPRTDLIQHDPALRYSPGLSTMGNSMMSRVPGADTGGKIKYWLFGHYHGSIDAEIDGIRYICNSQGRGGTRNCVRAYYPRRIEIDI